MDSSPVIEMAHKHGLAVHPYTFRSDVSQLPYTYFGNASAEYSRFFELGVDGVFSDFPSHARHARHLYQHHGMLSLYWVCVYLPAHERTIVKVW